MKYKLIITALVLLFVFLLVWTVFFVRERNALEGIQTFEDCLVNGYSVLESEPRQCSTPDGRIFTEVLDSETEQNPDSHADLIVVETPASNSVISNPLTVTGRARGFWYFEASFPVELYGQDGELLAIGIAQAQTEWMTEDFVDFVATLDYESETAQNGKLIFRKDNASGLPEHDDHIEIPVLISATR